MSETNTPPPAGGARMDWSAVPAHLRAAAEQHLGSAVVGVQSQPTGFSPGVAARLVLADGRRVFAKAVSATPNPDAQLFHRREARITAALPPSAPVPRLLWWHDDAETGWVVLVFEEVAGHHPAQPWLSDELNRVVDALAELSAKLTPSPLEPPLVPNVSTAFSTWLCGWRHLRGDEPSVLDQLDSWSARHLDELIELEALAPAAVAGDTLLHLDIRADNVLLTPDRVWFIDWPHASVGAAWVDVVFFAPSATMQGGGPPEQFSMRHPAFRNADPAAITAGLAAVAGFFVRNSLLPPPPGLPTLRAFQAAQGDVARAWLAERTGWE